MKLLKRVIDLYRLGKNWNLINSNREYGNISQKSMSKLIEKIIPDEFKLDLSKNEVIELTSKRNFNLELLKFHILKKLINPNSK